MGYDPSSDNGAQQWRDVYWTLGQNLVDMMTKAEAEERWDLLGVGYVLKAWGWQVLTDLHGEIIVKEAIDQTQVQLQLRHAGVSRTRKCSACSTRRSRCCSAPTAPSTRRTLRARDKLSTTAIARSGSSSRTACWRFNLNHYSNKATYKPADVIAAVNKSFTSNADDALLDVPGTRNNDDVNFWGRTRGNFTVVPADAVRASA